MDDLKKEKAEGFDWAYMADVLTQKQAVGDGYQIPGFGLAAVLFASMARIVLEKHGSEKGEALIRKAVEDFGRARGARIAAIVTGLGKPLTLKNWLIYSDIDASNFSPAPDLVDDDLVVQAGECTFWTAAQAFGLGGVAKLYCKYVDYAILEGYNPDIKLVLLDRHQSGKDFCVFRYIMKETNK